MIVFIQFPITDVRLFIQDKTGKLPLPLWPTPRAYKEFVRSFGLVKTRGKGGIRGWIGENEVCDACQALRFPRFQPFQTAPTNDQIDIKCSARHFYFDGLAVGKFELVLLTRPSILTIGSDDLLNLLEHLLHMRVSICCPHSDSIETDLCSAAKHLAKLYHFSSSHIKTYQQTKDKNWIIPGSPLIFIETGALERVKLPDSARRADTPSECNIDLLHYWFRRKDVNLGMWFLKRQSDESIDLQTSRTLRLYLMRLHAEYESLRTVLKTIDMGELCLSGETDEGNFLQHYLNEGTKRISRCAKRAEAYFENKRIEELAHESLDKINPGQLDSTLQKLRLAQIRPQILKKVAALVSPGLTLNIVKEMRMTVFDQRGQHVNYQYNAAGNINFEAVQNSVDFISELNKLKGEFSKAVAGNALDAETATDVEYQVTKAIQQASKPNPEKKSILDYLGNAKALVESISATSGLVSGIVKAIELAQKIF
jgi:hypothetical protein